MTKIKLSITYNKRLNETTNELYFIQELGRIRRQDMQRFNRVGLLEKYIAAANSRDDWGGIDKERCIMFAEDQLEEAVARQECVRNAVRRVLGYRQPQ